MAASYFFYDLETTGLDCRNDRIMQFAGQRTTLDFVPIDDPVNLHIKLTPDILPNPTAVMLTGITPQYTLAQGMSEPDFLKYFYTSIVRPDTTFAGYNSVRFDDEFMRFLHYRNFYDAYQWHYANGCSRWDIMDVTRLMRAIKPEGIEWPLTPEGKPTNKLELLTRANKLDHYKAHDALSDVNATIAVAKLLHDKQPKLFEYLREARQKARVKQIVGSGKPFMYTSSHFSSEHLHTTPTIMLTENARGDTAVVYDLREDPTPFLKMSEKELLEHWHPSNKEDALRLPIKSLKYNRCPAVVEGVVSDEHTLARLHLSRATISSNLSTLTSGKDGLAMKLRRAGQQLDEQRDQKYAASQHDIFDCDSRLYDGFFDTHDKNMAMHVQTADAAALEACMGSFHEDRANQLLSLYKARNFSDYLSSDERMSWEGYRTQKLCDGGDTSAFARYFQDLKTLASRGLDERGKYLLEELRLYGESIVPDNAID